MGVRRREFERPDGDVEGPPEEWPAWTDEAWTLKTTHPSNFNHPELTERQVMVLEAIGRLRRELGFPPSLRDLMTATGIGSTNGLDYHLKTLKRRGWLGGGDEGDKRTIHLLALGRRAAFLLRSTEASARACLGDALYEWRFGVQPEAVAC